MIEVVGAVGGVVDLFVAWSTSTRYLSTLGTYCSYHQDHTILMALVARSYSDAV